MSGGAIRGVGAGCEGLWISAVGGITYADGGGEVAQPQVGHNGSSLSVDVCAVVITPKYLSDLLDPRGEKRGWHATCTCGSPCKLHVSQGLHLLLHRRGEVLIVSLDFIHGRFWDLGKCTLPLDHRK